MTGRTTDPLMDVNAMIEVNESWKVVDPDPFDRAFRTKAFSHGREHWTISPDPGVAVHAGFCRRNSCERTFLDRRVAITAVNSVVPNVVFMAKRHGLDARYADFCDVRRFIDRRECSYGDHNQRDASKNTDP